MTVTMAGEDGTRTDTAAQCQILVADDDDEIRELIIEQLSACGYVMSGAASIAELETALKAKMPDILVLDLSLPDGDGLEFCRDLRADGFDRPVIMVTARDAPMDRVAGLEQGGDDYLTKPFEPRELVARIHNLLRRTTIRTTQPQRYAHFGPWILDLRMRRLVESDGHLVMLSASEFDLLYHFIQAPNRVLSREELLPERKATVAFDRSLDLRVSRLRRKLMTEKSLEDLILTVRGEGYVLASDVVLTSSLDQK